MMPWKEKTAERRACADGLRVITRNHACWAQAGDSDGGGDRPRGYRKTGMSGFSCEEGSRRGKSLPPSVQRLVFLFKLNGLDRAVRLLVFPNDGKMADYHGLCLRGQPVRGGFVQGYRYARRGHRPEACGRDPHQPCRG
jgi:hypothetical protein